MHRLLILAIACSVLGACSSKPSSSGPEALPVLRDASGDETPVEEIALPEEQSAVDSSPAPDVLPARAPMSTSALLGQVDPASDTAFVRIADKYTTKSGIYLRKAAYAAFQEMHAAAKADGIDLVIVSALRSFNSQKGIWERKWTGQTIVEGQNLKRDVPDPVERATKILRFSSMPGTSRHHWGTDIDLNNLNNSWFETGKGLAVYEWLQAHASDYGFCQVYSPMNEDRMHGYQEEKWHWSYLPLAKGFLADYKQQVGYGEITGFQGSETAEPLQVIDHYVGGINPDCQ